MAKKKAKDAAPARLAQRLHGDPDPQTVEDIPWWPTHRPLTIFTEGKNTRKETP